MSMRLAHDHVASSRLRRRREADRLIEHGCGGFVDEQTIGGRIILVRFDISDVTADSYRVEQAFSEDAG